MNNEKPLLKKNLENDDENKIQGIKLIKNPTQDHEIVILELENSSDINLLKKFSAISSRMSNAIILSTWFQNPWSKGGIEQIFLENLFIQSKETDLEKVQTKTSIILCVHDFDKDHSTEQTMKEYFNKEFSKLWEKVMKDEISPKENPFELNVLLMAHYKYQNETYKKQCNTISKMISKEGVISSNKKYNKKMPISRLFDTVSLEEKKDCEPTQKIGLNNSTLVGVYEVDKAFSASLLQSAIEMAELTKSVDENNKIPNFGKKAAEIIEGALQTFDLTTGSLSPVPFNKKKRQELEAILDTSLNSIFLKQLSILRELAIVHFKSATINEDVPVDFAYFTADAFFVRESEDSVRPGSFWSYATERTNVHNAIRELSNRRKQLISEKIQHAEHQANAFQYLQMQQAQMQAIQQQQYGGGAGNWNIGAAYRPPDSNLNISMGYQQGRTNIQISMVPDEQASLLGPNGFTAGVGPANLGLSLNLNL